jgi:hypothetical protein
MSWLKSRSIGAKLGILVGLPLVILIALTILSYLNSVHTSSGFTES